MKYMLVITFVLLISASTIHTSKNLKNTPQNFGIINAKAGRLSNVAHDATKLVVAQLASPKAEIKLNINHQGIVQKTEHIATTPTLGTKSVYDSKTKEWSTEPAVINHDLYATTTNVRNMNTYKTVTIDLTTGSAIPKTGARPNGLYFGTQ